MMMLAKILDTFKKSSRINFAALLFALLSSSSFAQVFPFDLWHDGKLVLESGDTIKGSIKYDLNDLLQIKYSGRLESFTARKVVFFEIFDQSYKRYRDFYSLPFSSTGGYKTPVFFEILTEGKITVLSREKIEYRTYSSPMFYYGGYSSRLVLVNIYFLLRENGNIEQFSGKRSDWYNLMGNRENDVHEYAKENRLDLDRKYDLKRVIDYYNSGFSK
jgi:hypothetical protein